MKFYFLPVYYWLAFMVVSQSAQCQTDSLVRQRLEYRSAKASEVYLVWATNYWNKPEERFWPKNTKLSGKSAFTLLNRNGNVFYTHFLVPKGTRIDYYFKISKNSTGKKVKAYDTNKGNTYFIQVQSSGTTATNDAHLEFYKEGFSLRHWSKYLLAGSACLLLFSLFIYRRNLRIKTQTFLPGFWLAAAGIVLLARAEITGAGLSHPVQLLAASLQDAVQLMLIGVLGTFLLYVFRNNSFWKRFVTGVFLAVLLIIVLISLLNIEVIRQLGTPFNYKWLYYSDFLKESDTNKAAAKTFTHGYMLQLTYLFASFLFSGFALHYLFGFFGKKWSRWAFLAMCFLLPLFCMLLVGKHHVSPARREAPMWAFVRSLYEPPVQAQLLQAPLLAATKNYFLQAAKPVSYPPLAGQAQIDNIIVFVSESTPANMVSVFGAPYESTPNLQKWSAMGRSFSNMYAHIPSTPNSMLSLVAGIYPKVDYKSALLEGVRFQTASLPQVLAAAGWTTSVFFSSDLLYSNMGRFVQQQGFQVIKDRSNLPCTEITQLNRADLAGMDDSCMVAQYKAWLNQNLGKKTFSVLWTNQTHIPYFANTEINFTGRKDNLNRYLNALHHTDAVFGDLMEQLKQRHMLERTLVVFIADHGEAFGTHDQKSHGSRVYEENVHIPCVLINPVLFKGEKDDAVSGMVDVAPTLAHIAGQPKQSGWQGKSLLMPTQTNRTFFVSPYTDLLIGTRGDQWKYIFNLNNREAELYNLQKDPKEHRNVADAYPQIVRQEHEALTGWFQYVHRQYQQLKPAKKDSVAVAHVNK